MTLRRLAFGAASCIVLAAVACSSDDADSVTPHYYDAGAGGRDAGADASWGGSAGLGGAAGGGAAGTPSGGAAGTGGGDAMPARCPADMVEMPSYCIDRYEAPNYEGQLPLVMYSFVESEAWCAARGKRLCFDDEWTDSCQGAAMSKYPYGDTHTPGVCNDDKLWRTYSQTLLNNWPASVNKPGVQSLTELFAAARMISANTTLAADHVEALYQGSVAGSHPTCASMNGAEDLVGNVEEWTRRRDGGSSQFHGNLKGRYWAESRTCQSSVTTHGDGFRFYEIGFRCCQDPN